jgi:hypothetical protein
MRLPLENAWQPIASAPRDGTIVEIENRYGVAPTYGIFRFVAGGWQNANEPRRGAADEAYLRWRPYKGIAKEYVDPTAGAQNTVKYWCDAMGLQYDAKNDRCIKYSSRC